MKQFDEQEKRKKIKAKLKATIIKTKELLELVEKKIDGLIMIL